MANKKRTSSVTPEQIVAARGAWTQREAAAAMGYSERQWQYFEAGTVSMSEAVFRSLQAARLEADQAKR
jgi:hypothetical protein